MELSSCLSKLHIFHGKYNNIISKVKSQLRDEEKFEPEDFIKNDPIKWFESIPQSYKEVLGINAHLETKYKHNFTSQATKGDMCGYSRETVNRAENYFKSVGVVSITPCGFNSNTLKISDWFRKNNLVFGISKIIPAFFCIAMLLPKPNVTREYYNDIYKRNINNTIAVNALEHNHSKTQNQGNSMERDLSSYENNINILKGEIAKTLTAKIDLNSSILICNIAKKLGCDIDIVKNFNDITKLSMVRNNPELVEKEF